VRGLDITQRLNDILHGFSIQRQNPIHIIRLQQSQ
jgi:hypothetical protein